MKTLKMWAGLGAACAACCAIPLLGLAGGAAGIGAALWACADEFLPVMLGMLALLVGLAFAQRVWRRRTAAAERSCGCESSCAIGEKNANC